MTSYRAIVALGDAIGETVSGIIIGLVAAHAMVFAARLVWRRWLREWCLRP
jgi:hypothetical protein